MVTRDTDRLLRQWEITFDNNSFRNYVDFVHDYYQELVNRRGDFKNVDTASWGKLLNWTRANAAKLEEGFFWCESKDALMAEKISNTLYIFEKSG
jgi:hypothetical protein